MNYINKRLNEVRQNGYQIDLGDLINESFESYKKIALLAGLALLIVILTLIIVVVFGLSYFTDFENLSEESMIMNFATFSPVEIAAYIGGVSLFAMFLAPFTAGLIKIVHDVETKDEVSFATIFECYKAGYLKDLLLSSLIISLITSTLTVVFQIIHLDFVGTLLSYVIGFLMCMTIPLIVFGKLSAMSAISNSIMVVSKQPLIIFLALLLAAIGSFIGFFGFCIGIFFTLPYLYCMYYAIYKHSVGFEE
ncbi:hypothetical protein FLJC2902T_16090 [Flavobacterium limnosediminis JC2902]|uniref:Beta-carotene 15,15'-monooxygenase n=1 Tax=Flavobacterium limnosediminis JC2902 TaxID=1341181 RepID=V6SNT5_9FLAO|nr:hypothetical protein [Flavobacterium limnosediminis]ESU28261.1 hypothetical protein FLJC2902T_16090 [Flavobacterium limnosediminis JC2902]